MIKRRFYKQDHGDRDDASEPSSSSDSELEAEVEEEKEEEETEEEDDVNGEVREKDESSGYESEDSSANQVDNDSSALLTSDADIGTGIDEPTNLKVRTRTKSSAETVDSESNPVAKKDSVADAITDCILKCKSVFKCRLCPRIVCLSEETLKAHLVSKRHARSVKLLIEGRLKLVLNSDGEMEERIHEEAHSPIAASGQNTENSKKKNKGRQRQRKRLMKKKTGGDLNLEKARQSTKKPAKKRHKSGN